MPKRPAKHQIEDRSRAKFQLGLPDAWVFRGITPDYGIDGEVEIFDEAGNSTSLSFLVQLKASESASKDRRLRVSLRKDQLVNYRQRDIPVLIVRYDKIDEMFYCRWAGTIDLYHSRKGTKSFSFKLSDDDEWNNQTPTDLLNDIERYRRLTSGSLRFPISVQLSVHPDTEIAGPMSVLRSRIRSTFEKANDSLSLAEEGAENFDVQVRVWQDEMSVVFGCHTGFTLHSLDLLNDEKSLSAFPRLVLEGVAVAIGYFGQYGLASALVLTSQDALSVDTHPRVGALLASCLLRAGHFEEALNYAHRLFETEEDQAIEMAFRIAAMQTAWHMPDNERQKLEDYLRGRLQREIDRGDDIQIGIANYNLGNHLRSVRKFSSAIHHYKLAGRFAPFYLKQRYYFREAAGALFGGGRFKMAAVFYERALAIDDSGRTRALYADALMFSGQYEEALNQFEAYFSSTDDSDPEWVLKAHTLDLLIETFGVKAQKRRKIEASACVICDENASVEDREASYEKAIELDALCSLAWFNSGRTKSKLANGLDDSRWRDAALSFLIAALTQPNDTEAWSNAVLCSFNHKETLGYLPLMIMCAFSINGDRFLSELNEFVMKQPGIGDTTKLVELIEEIALKVKSINNKDIEIRMLNENGSVEIVGEAH